MDKVFSENVRPYPRHPNKIYPRLLRPAAFLGLILLAIRFWTAEILDNYYRGRQSGTPALPLESLCPQVDPISSAEHEALLKSLDGVFGSDEFKLKAYESLSGAVRIPTESHDDGGLPVEDSRWEAMLEFHKYLELRFPKVHAKLKRTKVNKFALMYEWKGTEDTKPLLLTAHMDVVPVNPDTYDHWTHPPYSGHYDGKWIWGRGSCDDKNDLIGSLTTIETLLEYKFVPSRTILLGFGFDEEIGGRKGAREIAQYLLETLGPDSLAMIVDEGTRFTNENGTIFALPAVTEKGLMNIRMDVLTPGGHSSIPPKHTAIGILADLITKLEAHPHEPKLVRGRTYYQGLECRARYDSSFPESLTTLLLESQTSDKKLQELGDRLVDFDPLYYVFSGTTQAIDLVGGGVKVNALPEVAWAVANNRIVDHSSPAELMSRFTYITLPVAARHNMTLEAFGEMVGPQGSSWGSIRLSDFNNNAFGSAPVTPTTGSGPYELLSGTIQSVIQTHLRTDNLPRSVIVSPGLPRGNSDTRHYWNLTKHIFRYKHLGHRDCRGVHTINEAVRAEAYLERIRFYARLVLNADQSHLLE